MTKKPKVTVVTASFNLIENGREAYFRQCVESVHNQTYTNIEHWVIDGGSNDGTLELLTEYANKGWIKFISEPDGGIYEAMNKGIKNATGEYIAFLNSDDYWHDTRAVEMAVETFQKTDCDFCGGNTHFINETYPAQNYTRYANLALCFTRMPFCHQATFYKTSLIRKEGMYDTSYRLAADADLMFKLYFKKYKAAVIPLTFATFRMGGASFSQQELIQKEVRRLTKKYFNLSEAEFQNWLQKWEMPKRLAKKLAKFLKDKQDKNLPKLTVVTVCFNLVKAGRVKSFEACLKSVHEQTYPNIEHLVIDGASTDGTLDIIKEYAKKGWISYVSEPDKGIYDAMTKGVQKASGDYIYFLNTDDAYYDNDVVADAISVLESHPIDAVFGDIYAYLLDKKVNYLEVLYLNKRTSFKECEKPEKILDRNIHHQTMFYRKNLFVNNGFFCAEIPEGSDWLFNVRAFIEQHRPYRYIDRAIARFNLGGVSTNTKENPIEYTKQLKKILNEKYHKYLPSKPLSKEEFILPSSKKIKIFGLPLIKIKTRQHKKKVYFCRLPIFKMKNKLFKKKYFLFGLPILKINNRENKKKYYVCGIPVFKKKNKVGLWEYSFLGCPINWNGHKKANVFCDLFSGQRKEKITLPAPDKAVEKFTQDYQKRNKSYKETCIFHVGYDQGLFSEINHMVATIVHCDKNKIKFKLFSDTANFANKKGWKEFFKPFSPASHCLLNKRFNYRHYAGHEHKIKKHAKAIQLLKKLTGAKYLTFEKFFCPIMDATPKMDFWTEAKPYARMVWRLNDKTKHAIYETINALDLPKDYLAIQIRRGDKMRLEKQKTAPMEKYAKVLKKVNDIHTVFVFCDDYEDFRTLQNLCPGLNLLTLCTPEEKGYDNIEFNQLSWALKEKGLLKLLTNMEILMNATHCFGTVIANPSLFLKMAMDKKRFEFIEDI